MVRRYSSFKAFVLLYSFALSGVPIFSNFAQNAAELPPEMMMGTPDIGVPEAFVAPPEPVAPAAQTTSQVASSQPSAGGPETVNLPQEKFGTHGNWMKKRDWLMQTNAANNELQELVLAINSIRKTYNEKYRGVDEILDTFYKQLGEEQGKLHEMFDSIARYLEKKKTKEVSALSVQSHDEYPDEHKEDKKDKNLPIKIELIEQQINTLKGSLEQLKLDMKSVEDLDRSIAERMKKVDEQISIANDEAASAQKMTDDLWYIIDDKKARAYYYEIKGSSLEKVKVIDSYLKGDLLSDFDTVIDTVKAHITKTQDSIKALEDKGIIIKNRAFHVEKLKIKDLQDAEKKAQEEELARQKAAAEKARIAKLPKTWYGKLYKSITDFLSSCVTSVSDLGASLYKKFFGSTKTTPKKALVKPTLMPETNEPAKSPVSTPVQNSSEKPSAMPQAQSTPTELPQAQAPEAQSEAQKVPAIATIPTP